MLLPVVSEPLMNWLPARLNVNVPAVALNELAALLLLVRFVPLKVTFDDIANEAGSLITMSPPIVDAADNVFIPPVEIVRFL